MKTQIIASAFALASTATSAQDVARTLPAAADAVAPALAAYATEDLFGSVWTDETLDAGVTPAELSETITHLAFYTGWGRCATRRIAMMHAVSLNSFVLVGSAKSLSKVMRRSEPECCLLAAAIFWASRRTSRIAFGGL
ncbi:hypothetical protein BZA02_1235 [Ruegeria sp. P4]|nr:hypothetical protein BZA02_1235 [Ruegeria sp. P4]